MKLRNKFTEKIKVLAFRFLIFYIIFCFYEWNFNPGQWDTLSRVAVVLLIAFVTIGES